MPWDLVIAVVGGLVLLWVVLVGALSLVARREDDPMTLRDVVRLVPDVVRLLRRLAADPELPRGVRWRLGALLAYLLLPIDLVPDFIPVVGYADDAVVVALALRSVVRRAGPEALDRHWTGTEQGLAAVKRLAGVRPQ
ncbi:YkvA family protein [Nocardioides marmoribigeumensis]|uniref:Uncharacterized membrane protein YkvA (DUF1232 family) n=1 Tax=Nocardioides marmoribigeumensis TaxID=433649 RepID=A0ABU2BWW4_9ACTN|nr:uncharacterized membrane protein YkvA (DUF1232 family) [Nocardioides marmoribigeumensis]